MRVKGLKSVYLEKEGSYEPYKPPATTLLILFVYRILCNLTMKQLYLATSFSEYFSLFSTDAMPKLSILQHKNISTAHVIK